MKYIFAKLWVRILVGLLVGLILGALMGPKALIFKPIGSIFLNLISMLIVPLIFSMMTVGITSIHDPKKLGRVGLKASLLYLGTTVIAILLGIIFAKLFKPGVGVELMGTAPMALQTAPPKLSDLFLSMFPSNAFKALSSGNVLQIIVFAGFLGISIHFTGEKGKPLANFLNSMAEVMHKMTSIVMKFAPVGVCAIMAAVSGSFGIKILLPLFKLLFTIYFVSILHFVLIFGFILVFMAKLRPLPFYKGMRDAMAFAFSTTSSSASIPVLMHCAEYNLGVSRNIASFAIPFGCTVNMNGTAIFMGISSIFIAQSYGVELSFSNLIILVVTATLSAVGTAGVPGAGLIILSIVLTSVGLPIEGVGILLAIDRLRDMVGTVLNVVGDAVVAVYVAKTEGELDETIYYNGENVSLEDKSRGLNPL